MLYGFGATTIMVTASSQVTRDAGEHTGVASAAAGASQQIGAALGTGLLSSIAVAAAGTYERANGLDPGDVAATVHGLTRASLVAAVIVASGTMLVAMCVGFSERWSH